MSIPRRSRTGALLRAIILPACLSVTTAWAQQNDVPLNRDIYYDIDRNSTDSTSWMHTGLRPLIQSRTDLRNVMGFRPDSSRHYYFITAKLTREHLVQVQKGDFRLTIDPVFRFEMGRDLVETSVANTNQASNNFNARGFWITADLGKRLSFQTGFYENQAILPLYLYVNAQATGVIPGQGRVKKFGARGFDFAWAHGNVSWAMRPWLNVQFGNGRHFVGNGYRSMLLSDNTFPYPYLKLSALTNNKRLQYTVINAKFQHVTDPVDRLGTGNSSESLFYWKRASFKHVSVNLGPAQLGLFEATIWRNIDSTGVRPFDAMELNPVIGANTIANGFGGRNKSLVGIDARVRLPHKCFAYGQFAVDDPARQRTAWQVGAQLFDVLRKDLHLLIEYNVASPFTYASSYSRGSYSHFNQPLAHPLGAGFAETNLIIDYGIKERFWLRAHGSWAQYEADTSTSRVSGTNIFDTREEQGADSLSVTTTRGWLDLSFSYRMNPSQNTSLSVGMITRDVNPAQDIRNSHYFYICFRTGLFNRYYDL